MRRFASIFVAGSLALLLVSLAPAAIAFAQNGTPPAGYAALDGARYGSYLKLGSQGPAVAALQRALTAVGLPVQATGYFGNYTIGLVREFQRRSGIGVDGVVGPQTVAAFDRALGLAPGGAPNPPPAGPPPGGSPATGIPARPAWAATGTQFIARTNGLTRAQREAAILAEVLSGNIPDFERRFREVSASYTGPDLRPHTIVYRVMPDYIAIGSDADFVRMPMNPLTAQRIADRFGCVLPTRKMVNDIYRQATVKLAPIPLVPGPLMMSNDYYLTHQRRIEGQRAGKPLGALTGGHKKDVVISNLLLSRPDRVAIYGWHQLNGQPIQPLSTVHENTYADYSHGIRLVDRVAFLDGRPVLVSDVLRDATLWRLLGDEGAMPSPRIPGVPTP
jgi:hypothetical protein